MVWLLQYYLKPFFCFEIISGLQNSGKDNIGNFNISFTKVPLMLPSYIIIVLLSKLRDEGTSLAIQWLTVLPLQGLQV